MERRRMKDRAVVASVRREHDHGLRMRDRRGIRASNISITGDSGVKGIMTFCFLCKDPFAVGGGGFQAGWREGTAAWVESRFLLSRVLDFLTTSCAESLLVLLCSPWPIVSDAPDELFLLSLVSSSTVEPDDRLSIGCDTQLAFTQGEVNRVER